MDIILGDMAQNSHSYFRPNWHAAASSLYCHQLEPFVDMLGSCISDCLTNRKSQLDLLAEVVEEVILVAWFNGDLRNFPMFGGQSNSCRQPCMISESKLML
ncbi:uncharacterized protein LOC117619618 [Prunus dulcis]|uniref:uncharacterized protein LOC117617534 n=1 Tax=Prunus dulcis TaxID=3755 RepID=UPI001482E64A|nr:uncharacterized protein LOC117617534 [Prunus dulcis]XP_034205508.1 uncharacterized protein LOC117619618 [Prunus dulcis]